MDYYQERIHRITVDELFAEDLANKSGVCHPLLSSNIGRTMTRTIDAQIHLIKLVDLSLIALNEFKIELKCCRKVLFEISLLREA